MSNDNQIRVGVVVRSLGPASFEGIVCKKKVAPSDDWIDDQLNADVIRRLGNKNAVSWWGVMPFGGGFAECPEPLLSFLRPATYEDFLRAVDLANPAGRLTLAQVFPEFVDRVLAERKRSQE